jgi:GDPmannose 4,6-dehydratase
MWLMLQQSKPNDYVVATGEGHTVREFAEIAFEVAGLNYEDWIVTDPKLLRPAEVDSLLGNPARAEKELKWKREVSFEKMIQLMVEGDLERYKNQGYGKTVSSKPRSIVTEL